MKKKVYYHAAYAGDIKPDDVKDLAKFALDHGARAQRIHLKALALAKLSYVQEVFNICLRHNCKAFASIVETDAESTSTDGLRKDYAYLFERFFYFLEDNDPKEHGIIVFDELDKSKSHILIGQAHAYFKSTAIGRHRASLIVPEPFFVHSDLTTGIQISDLIAYIISWGFRSRQMIKPARDELHLLASQVGRMRHRAHRDRNGNPQYVILSFAHISDLRTRLERDLVE